MKVPAQHKDILRRALAQLQSMRRFIEVHEAYRGAMTAEQVEKEIERRIRMGITRIEIGANGANTLAAVDFDKVQCAELDLQQWLFLLDSPPDAPAPRTLDADATDSFAIIAAELRSRLEIVQRKIATTIERLESYDRTLTLGEIDSACRFVGARYLVATSGDPGADRVP